MGEQNLLGSLLPLVAIFGIFYFLIIRPQQKQAKIHKAMLSELAKGDKVTTTGGVIVEIEKVEETFYLVKNVDNTKMKIAKDFITNKLDK